MNRRRHFTEPEMDELLDPDPPWPPPPPPPPTKRQRFRKTLLLPLEQPLVPEGYKSPPSCPDLFEIEKALKLIEKRYPGGNHMRRELRRLARRIEKHYGVIWVTPWKR